MGRKAKVRATRAAQPTHQDQLIQIPPGHKLVTIFEFGRIMYQHYGRGVVSYPGAGFAPKYVCGERLDPIDTVAVKLYNPAIEIVITCPLVDGEVKGVWQTTNVGASDPLANLRLLLPEAFLAGDKGATLRLVVS